MGKRKHAVAQQEQPCLGNLWNDAIPHRPGYPNLSPYGHSAGMIPPAWFPNATMHDPGVWHFPQQSPYHVHSEFNQQWRFPPMESQSQPEMWDIAAQFENHSPMRSIPEDRIKTLDEIAVRAYQKDHSEGRGITVWGIVKTMLAEVGAELKDVQLHSIPCLRTLFSIEGKVNAFIVSYVAGNRIATLHDLVVSLCQEEGVKKFEELGLGPILSHPLVIQYFFTGGLKEVFSITALEVIQCLTKFIEEHKEVRQIEAVNLLSFIARERSLPSRNHLCVRIQSLGMYIGLVQKAKRREQEMIQRWEASASRPRVGQIVHEFLSSKLEKKTPTHIRFSDSDSDSDDPIEAGKPVLQYSTCPYPSAAEERSRAKLHPLIIKSRYNFALDNSTLAKFIETWQHASRNFSVTEVLKRILESGYTDKQKQKFTQKLTQKQMRKLSRKQISQKQNQHLQRQKQILRQFNFFKLYPAICLLNVAILSMKAGHPNNMCDQLQLAEKGIGDTMDRSHPVSVDTPSTKGSVPANLPGVSVGAPDDIILAVVKHLNHYIPDASMKGKEWCNILKWAIQCEKHLIDQYSDNIISSLGCKSFLEYLERNISSITLENSNLVSPAVKRVTISRRRVAAFVHQASNAAKINGTLSSEDTVARCCKQFQLRSIEELGLGSTEDLISLSQEHNTGPLFFSAALVGEQKYDSLEGLHAEGSSNTSIKVGKLGNMTGVDAQKCLSKAPMLCDLLHWSQWATVFEPQLGPLVDWLENDGASSGISVLLTCSGTVLRIDGESRPEKFLAATAEGRPADVASQLVSLVVLHGGAANAPKELLKSHASKGLEIFAALVKEKLGEAGDDYGRRKKRRLAENEQVSSGSDCALGGFVLDCLVNLPQEFCVFAAEVLFSVLSSLVSGAAGLLLRTCSSLNDHLVLHTIGLSMGISEWISDYTSFEVFHVVDNCKGTEIGNEEHYNKRLKLDALDIFPDTKRVEMHGGDIEMTQKKRHKASDEDLLEAEKFQAKQERKARQLIEAIRSDEFGLKQGFESTESSLLAKQHARMGRALHCLSHNLYSEDCHFILELVQNADDNTYPLEVSAALAFVVQNERIVVLNNEQGFTAKNMRALCDVGNSTKLGSAAGYVGHKGIGFKSVFRVTDSPEIHSNGFHVKFDISESTLGFILPTWVKRPDDNLYFEQIFSEAVNGGVTKLSRSVFSTRIDLPLKPSVIEEVPSKTVSSMFQDLQPNLLLFLHKLRTLVVRDESLQASRIMHRHDLGHNLVRVTDGETRTTFLVVQQQLHAAVHRSGISVTELALAFGLKELPGGLYESHPVQQQVFAFLPVRSYGLKFIVQGDFILPSSREELDRDNAWNQWLRSEIPKLFLRTLESFKSSPLFGTRSQATTSYMSFVPMDGEVLGFFSSLPRMILSQLRAVSCLPVDGADKWALPCMTLRGWDDTVRELMPDEMLREHLGIFYLDRGVLLNNSLASSLGVPKYGAGILTNMMKAVCNKYGQLETLGVRWVRMWLVALHKCIFSDDKQKEELELVKSLRNVPFIPLSSGAFTSLELGPVWFLNSGTDIGAEAEDPLKSFLALYSDIRTVHPLLLFDDNAGEAGIVRQMLTRMGCNVLHAHEIIKTHVLPMMSKEDCFTKDPLLVVQYLAYCMLHLQFDKCRSCEVERAVIMAEMKRNAVLLTDRGLRKIGYEAIHFSMKMGNVVDMKKILHETGVQWSEIGAEYFHVIPSHMKEIRSSLWRNFFSELGVNDFIQVMPSNVRITDKSTSIWKDDNWGAGDTSEWIVQDWECPEMLQILNALAHTEVNRGRPQQCALLLSALDRFWDDRYEQFAKSRYSLGVTIEKDEECSSSFILQMRQFAWINSSLDGQLRMPTQLFHRCDTVVNMFGSHAPYAVPQIKSGALVRALGLRTDVIVDDVINLLKDTRHSEANFTASLAQMERLYTFLWEKMPGLDGEVLKLFKCHSCIFLPSATVENRDLKVSGRFYSMAEVTWDDPFKCLDKLEKVVLPKTDSEQKFPTRTLCKLYPRLQSFFVDGCCVPGVPNFDNYISILQQLAANFPPSKVLLEVLGLFAFWSQEIDAGELGADELLRRRELVQEKNASILPTMQDSWVGLNNIDVIVCWCDDATLVDEFDRLNTVIQFVNIGHQESKRTHRKPVVSFLQALGVPRFSEIVEREVISYGPIDHTELEDLIKWVIPYAQRYLLQFQPETYERFLASNALDQLRALQCLVADQLFFRYTIRNGQVLSRRRMECSCLLQGDKLHVSLSHAKDYASIYLELSRLFFAGKANNPLANFLHLITLQAQTSSSESGGEALIASSQGLVPLPEGQTPWKVQKCNDDADGMLAEAFLERHRLRTAKSKNVSTDNNWPPRSWLPGNTKMSESTTGKLMQGNEQKFAINLANGAAPFANCTEEQIDSTGAGCGQVQSFGLGRESLYTHPPNEQQQDITGRVGEKLVFEHLYKKHGSDRVRWVNEAAETGAAYDIIINKDNGVQEFVEVKSTRASNKDWFEISSREWEFASQMRDRYTIVRVFLLENQRRARLMMLQNPVQLCHDKVLQLAVIVPNERQMKF